MTTHVVSFRKNMLVGGMIVSTFALLTILLLQGVKAIEQEFFPVLVDWEAEEVRSEGEHILVSGYQRKVRDCTYVAPIRAETLSGEHLLVTSRAPASGQNWQAGPERRRFGPWVIHGTKGRAAQLYAEHRCHPFWTIFSRLGPVEARR
jgi:hypothetical protein